MKTLEEIIKDLQALAATSPKGLQTRSACCIFTEDDALEIHNQEPGPAMSDKAIVKMLEDVAYLFDDILGISVCDTYHDAVKQYP